MKTIVNSIYKNKKLFLILLIFIAILSIPFLARIGISNSLNIWFPKNDPSLKSYNTFLQKFGNDETIVIGLKSKAKFTSKGEMSYLHDLVKQLDLVKGTGRAIWFKTPFINPKYEKVLLSNDSMKTIVIIPMTSNPNFGNMRGKVIDSIKNILKNSHYEFHLAGMGVIYDGLNKATQRNGSIFVLLSFVFIFLFLILFLRDFKILFISILSVSASIMILFGIYALIDRNINIITIVIPVLILIYGISDIIYIVYSMKLHKNSDARVILSQILAPCFLTSLTTSIGFLSLLLSKITAIRQIGLYGGMGVLIEFLVTSIIMIYFSDIIKNSPKKPVLLNSVHNTETKFVEKHYQIVVGLFFLFILVFSYGIRYIKIDTYTIKVLRGKNRVKTDSDWIENNIGNYLPLELLVKTNNVNNSKFKEEIKDFQKSIGDKYGYTSFSYYDIQISSVLMLMAGKNKTVKYYDRNTGKIRITVYVPALSARQVEAVKDSVIGTFRNFSKSPIEISGYIPLYIKIIDYIAGSQFKSFPLALIIIFLFMTLLFGIKNGLIAVIPNLVPIIAVLGTMGYFKIPLDIGTVIITPIIIGVVVDDTIHYIFAKKHDNVIIIRHPMLITSILLSLGFLICIFANITTIAYFGILSSIAIFTAYLGDAILLPSLYKIAGK